MKCKTIGIYLIIAMLSLQLIVADQPDTGYQLDLEAPGFDPGKPYYGSGFGTSVNLFSGALMVQAPGATVPGRNGLGIAFQPSYSSMQVFYENVAQNSDQKLKRPGPLGLGWSGWHFGRVKFFSTIGTGDGYINPQMVVEESDGTILPFIIDTDDNLVPETGTEHAGILLSDGSRIIWYIGDCEDYQDLDNCNTFRQDELNYIATGSPATYIDATHAGKAKFVRVMPDGTRYTYAHFVGPGLVTDVDWWEGTGSYASGQSGEAFALNLPRYDDRNDDIKGEHKQMLFPGYYVTRIEDTNGNYVDFTYYEEVLCKTRFASDKNCHPFATFYNPDTTTGSYPTLHEGREGEVYMTSPITYGSPYVKEAMIQAFACKDSPSDPSNCDTLLYPNYGVNDATNTDIVDGKEHRSMKFFYESDDNPTEPWKARDTRLAKVTWKRTCDNDQIDDDCSGTRKENSLRFKYATDDIIVNTGGFDYTIPFWQLTEVELFDEDTGTSLFPKTTYAYYDKTPNIGDSADARKMEKITVPQGGEFIVDYDDHAFKAVCDRNSQDPTCERDISPVGSTTVKESLSAQDIVTKYYYKLNQNIAENGNADPLLHIPGTRETYVVAPNDGTGTNGDTVTRVVYYTAYDYASGGTTVALNNNWKSGLTMTEETWDADFDENSLGSVPGEPDDYEDLLDGKLMSKTTHFWDSVFLGDTLIHKTSGPNIWTTVQKPLKHGTKTCVYDPTDPLNTVLNFDNAAKRCTLVEYEYWSEFDELSNTKPHLKDPITVGSETFYDSMAGLVKKTINYGEVGDAGTYKEYFSELPNTIGVLTFPEVPGDQDTPGCYELFSGKWKNVCGEAYLMHGDIVKNDVDTTDNIITETTYTHRRSGHNGKFFGWIGEQDCMKHSASNYCLNNDLGKPEFLALTYPHEVTVKDGSGNILSKTTTEYDEMHWSGETFANRVDDIMWKRYTHEPNARLEPAMGTQNLYLNSVPNMNPTTVTVQVYDKDHNPTETRIVSSKYEIDSTPSFTTLTDLNDYGGSPSNVFTEGYGNVFKTRKPDRQASPQDNFFADDYGVVNLVYDVSNWNLVEQYEYVDDYDGTGGYLTTPRQKLTSSLLRDPIRGNIVRITDPNENYNVFYYDKLGRITATSSYGRCTTGNCPHLESESDVLYTYTDGTAGEWSVEVKQMIDTTNFFNPVKNVYDGLGRNFKTEQDDITAGCVLVTESFFDTEGKLYESTVKPYQDCGSGGSTDKSRFKKYDAAQRVLEMIPNTDGAYIADEIETIYTEDTTTVINPKGAKSITTTDGFGRNILTEAKDSLDVLVSKTEYEYNVQGQLIKVTDGNTVGGPSNPGKVTDYEYNSIGETQKVEHPDNGIQEFDYDKAGRVISKKQLGNTGTTDDIETITHYDSLGRPRLIEYKVDGVLQTDFKKEFIYDNWNMLIDEDGQYATDIDCNTRGRLAFEYTLDEGEEISQKYCYDHKGRIDFIEKSVAGKKFVVQYDYDRADNVIEELYPDAKKVEYLYNDLGQLDKIEVDDVEVVDYDYNPSGSIDVANFGNGVDTAYTYNAKELVETMTTSKGTDKYYERTYEYDKNNNLETLKGAAGELLAEFDYDALDRLTDVTDDNYYGKSFVYTYDNVGNRDSVTVDGGTAETYKYYDDRTNNLLTTKDAVEAGTNRLAQTDSFTYTYDGRGNMIERDSITGLGTDDETFEYDVTNMLRSIKYGTADEWARYWYDSSGQRVVKKEDLLYRSVSLSSMVVGKNDDIYISKETTGQDPLSQIYNCDKFGLECEHVITFGPLDLATVTDMAYNKDVEVLFLLDSSRDVYMYGPCESQGMCKIGEFTDGDVFAIATESLAPNINLINNPSLEISNAQQAHFSAGTTTKVFEGIPDLWAFTEVDTTGTHYVEFDDSEPKSGIDAIKVVDNSDQLAVAATFVTSAEPGTTYTCSAYANIVSRTNNPGATGNGDDNFQDLYMYFYNSAKERIVDTGPLSFCDGVTCTTADHINSQNGNYHRYHVTRTSPTDTAYVGCFANSITDDESTYLWDDFQINTGTLAAFQGYQAKLFMAHHTIFTNDVVIERIDPFLDIQEREVTITDTTFSQGDPDLNMDVAPYGDVYVASYDTDKIYYYDFNADDSDSGGPTINEINFDDALDVAVDEFGNRFIVYGSLITGTDAVKMDNTGSSVSYSTKDIGTSSLIDISGNGIYLADKYDGIYKFPDRHSFQPAFTYYVGNKGGNYMYERKRSVNLASATPNMNTFKVKDANVCNQIGGCSGDTDVINSHVFNGAIECVGTDFQNYAIGEVTDVDGFHLGLAQCVDDGGQAKWTDCDESQAVCGGCAADEEFVLQTGGCTGTDCWVMNRATVRYPADFTDWGQMGCCGDDIGEYYTETVSGLTGGCCQGPGMVLQWDSGRGDYVCIDGTPEPYEGASPLVFKLPPEQKQCNDLIAQLEDCSWTGSECICN